MAMLPSTYNYDLNGNQLQFVDSKFSTTDASGLPAGVSSGYTSPDTSGIGQVNLSNFAPSVTKNQNGQQAASNSTFGITPQQAGSVASKAFNTITGNGTNTFGKQVEALDNFGNTYLGTGAADTIGGLNTSALSAGTEGLSDSLTSTGFGADTLTDAGTEAAGLTATSLSSILGSAGIGAIGGGLLASLTGGNTTNGTIGGAIGGAVGSAAMGTTLGAAIGSFIPIPGIGTILGSAVGGLLGSAFGPSEPPSQASGYGGTLTATGGISNPTQGTRNSTAAPSQNALSGLTDMTQQAAKDLGINFNTDLVIGAATSDKHPGPGGHSALEVNDPNTGYDSGKIFYEESDPVSKAAAYKQAFMLAAQQSGYTDQAALDKWYSSYDPSKGASTGAFNPPSAPTIPTTGSSFAQFMTNKQGTPTNGNATPAVPPTPTS